MVPVWRCPGLLAGNLTLPGSACPPKGTTWVGRREEPQATVYPPVNSRIDM